MGIKYSEGLKYRLREDYSIKTKVTGYSIFDKMFRLVEDGTLTIYDGYTWDGASGPTIDTKSSMRGSLVHDVGYQMMRLGLIPESTRPLWDDMLHDICVEDGMWHFRAEGWEEAVSHFAAGCAKSGAEPEILEAP